MIRIGVISDTHIPDRALELPSEILYGLEGVDCIIHAGDCTQWNVIEQLRSIAPVHAVQGNMDDYIIKQQLPLKKVVEFGTVRIGITHGHGGGFGNIKKKIAHRFKDDNVDCIVFGHTHQAEKTMVNDILFFNPGSAVDDRSKSIGIFTFDDNSFEADLISF